MESKDACGCIFISRLSKAKKKIILSDISKKQLDFCKDPYEYVSYLRSTPHKCHRHSLIAWQSPAWNFAKRASPLGAQNAQQYSSLEAADYIRGLTDLSCELLTCGIVSGSQEV